MGTAKHYLFRVMSHGTDGTTVSTSDELKYDLPDNVKQKAVTAGLIGKKEKKIASFFAKSISRNFREIDFTEISRKL